MLCWWWGRSTRWTAAWWSSSTACRPTEASGGPASSAGHAGQVPGAAAAGPSHRVRPRTASGVTGRACTGPWGPDYLAIFALAASQSAFVISMNPLPLQEFWPLQALLALLQADWPLQELTPLHWTLASSADAEGMSAGPKRLGGGGRPPRCGGPTPPHSQGWRDPPPARGGGSHRNSARYSVSSNPSRVSS